MEVSRNQRFAELIKLLIDKNLVYNQVDFAQRVGIGKSLVTELKKGVKTVTESMVERIVLAFPDVNEQWLLTGEGEMLKKKGESPALPYKEVSRQAEVAIPFFDDYMLAACGPSGFADGLKLTDASYISIPNVPRCDFAIRTTGRSMINRSNPELSIPEGAIVCCRYWKSANYVKYGGVYALSTEDGIIIKQLQQSDDPDTLLCVSFNKEDGFQPFKVPKGEIYPNGLAEVVAVIAVTYI